MWKGNSHPSCPIMPFRCNCKPLRIAPFHPHPCANRHRCPGARARHMPRTNTHTCGGEGGREGERVEYHCCFCRRRERERGRAREKESTCSLMKIITSRCASTDLVSLGNSAQTQVLHHTFFQLSSLSLSRGFLFS